MELPEKPYLIDFQSIGSSELGYITVAENNKNVPFEIKRVYWTYYTPQSVQRGGHAHHNLYQVIFCVSGKITLKTESIKGEKETFTLEDPQIGLFIPKLYWRDIVFSHSAVLLCLASEPYSVDDYIRNYDQFKLLRAS
jgi:dTDP-4-dehydrorhamnose 3,5-epimerase-like enzyme